MEPSVDCNLLGLFLAHAAPLAGRQAVPELDGIWKCDDGGLYYVRQIGPDVLWYGESDPGEAMFANVAHGTVDDHGCLRMRWADVPKGVKGACGELVLRVTDATMQATRVSGGFGGQRWWR